VAVLANGSSGGGSGLGAGGSSGFSASLNLWQGGPAFGSFGAFMAAAAGAPSAGTWLWGGILSSSGAGATSFNAAASMTYNGVAATAPTLFNGVLPTPSNGVAATAPCVCHGSDDPCTLPWCVPNALPWRSTDGLPRRHPNECCASWMARMVDRSSGRDTEAGLAPCGSWSFDIGWN
jgi:hypothetical protein